MCCKDACNRKCLENKPELNIQNTDNQNLLAGGFETVKINNEINRYEY